MKPFTVIKTDTGEVLRSGSCSERDYQYQAGEGETILEITPTVEGWSRWDGERFVGREPRPTRDHLWVNGAWEIDLVKARKNKISWLNALCSRDIVDGFFSEALGYSAKYDSEETDQANLIGAVLSGLDRDYKCTVNGVKSWVFHTNNQLRQVLVDGASHKETLLKRVSVLKDQVAEATTYEDIEAIGL